MDTKREHAQYNLIDESTTLQEPVTQPNRTYLYISVAILNLQFLMCGTAFAWSSPMLVKLQLSASEGSTVASALPLGIMLGPLVSGALLDRLGRKATVGLSMGILTGCYVILTVVSSVSLLSLGRFMAGITVGITFAAIPLYIAEISEDSVRGFLNTMNQLSVSSGSLLVYGLGPLISYAALHYILLGLCAAFFLLFPLLPESPYSLVMKNKVLEAKHSLTKLRGNSPESLVAKELQIVQKTITESREGSKSIKELFISRGNRLALTICLVLIACTQFCGTSIVFFYLEQIFQMTGTNLSSSTCSIMVGFIMVASGFISPVAVNYFGYKKPLLFSTSGMTLGMGLLGGYLTLKYHGVEVDTFSWLPLLSVVVFIVSFNVGFANIPWALAGELFTNNTKSSAVTLVGSTSGFLSFLTVKLFPHLTAMLGLHLLFCTCAFSGLLTIAFIWAVVRDTSSMSFVEIQLMLNGRSAVPLNSHIADVEL